jgi:Putative transposase
VAVDYRQIILGGSVAEKDFSCRSRSSVVYSAGSLLPISRLQTSKDGWSFMANRNIWPEGDHFASLLNDVSKCEWVIYAKRPFGGPVQVLKYLARYTHRVAISNHRLVSLSNGEVTFRWKDYADGNAVKEMTLDVREFTRRFLLHILQSGFVRIRHYGLLANRCRSERLECCRKLLVCSANQAESPERANEIESQNDAEPEPQLCPVCLIGRMLILKKFEPGESGLRASLVLGADTS